MKFVIFLKSSAHYLTVSIVFSVYKHKFMAQWLKNLSSYKCGIFSACFVEAIMH